MDIQIIIFELNLRKEKWLVVSVDKPPAQDATYFLNWLSQIIDFYSITYEKQVIIGDFNLTPHNKSMREFVDLYNLINLIKTTTSFKKQSLALIFYRQTKNIRLKIQTHLKLA